MYFEGQGSTHMADFSFIITAKATKIILSFNDGLTNINNHSLLSTAQGVPTLCCK